MRVRTNAFWLHKDGNSSDEYEDALCPDSDAEFSGESFRAAIADGATEASFSQLWAKLLVRSYCKTGFVGVVSDRIKRLQLIWHRLLRNKPLPWFAQEKMKAGAFASVVGLTLYESASGRYNFDSLAVGDSCLFQFRKEKIILSWPLNSADQFNSRPILLSSEPEYNSDQFNNFQRSLGSYESGDLFLMMTDALACWFLQSLGPEGTLSSTLRQIVDIEIQSDFEKMINRLRVNKFIRNDDVTLLRVTPQ
jgi:hypothetical protein